MIRRACLAALLTLSASTAFGVSNYDHLYAFGDSYSDNGAGEALTTRLAAQKVKEAQALPGPLYWKGALEQWPHRRRRPGTGIEHSPDRLCGGRSQKWPWQLLRVDDAVPRHRPTGAGR